MKNNHRFFPVDAIAWGVLLFTLSAQAQEHTGPSPDDRFQQLMDIVDRQQREISSLKQRLTDLEMTQRARGLTAWDTAQISPSDGTAAGTAGAAAGGAAGSSGAGSAAPIGQTQQMQRSESEAQRSPGEEAVVQREHAPLFDKKLTIDAGLSYGYYDRRQLALTGFLALDAIFLGTLNLGETKASVWTFDVNTRYGLTDRLSVAVDIPYLYRNTNFISGGVGGASTTISDISKNSSAIGDVNASLYYQIVKESTGWPDIVGSLRVTAPTGTSPFGIKLVTPDPNNNNLQTPERLPTGNGIWSLTAGVSFLRTYDPIVLFANVAYTYNIARSFNDISAVSGVVQPAKVKLGDVVQVGAGMALALNDKTALSISYSTAISRASKTQVPGGSYTKVAGSATNAASLNFGINYAIDKHWTFNGYVNAGMSPDAPNYVIGVRFPYTF
ncbi:hypothetical protein PTE30175_01948 [Pandoraea terrae]|uniref:Transporter n=1 Tax=Pandoraea terrae TaxID=1537710 RepID=A0A5E4UFC9_9BURK|nr:hypothetical protein [Pandoraea terrae]VVD98766.1 hypothetical protein PTE30175_01948 [Pandoraea terrae]